MINKFGQIDVPVGCTFNDGNNSYRAIRPHDCAACFFNRYPFGHSACIFLACVGAERFDGLGVHFIKEGGEG